MREDEYNARKEETARRANNPQVGDYWNEMFSPICVVVKTDTTLLIRPRSSTPIAVGTITICKKTKEVDADSWTWDLSVLETMTVDAFREWLSYGSIPGYWAMCCGSRHTWVTDFLEEECHATQ
jgi:hypothetical protein